MDNHVEELIEFKERSKSNTKRIDALEIRMTNNEEIMKAVDKSLQVTVEKINNIAEDLKQTSINFKEAMMRSNTANSKETEILKEKYNELEKKYEKLDTKIQQETVMKDAKNWRKLFEKIGSTILGAVLALIIAKIGLS